MTPRLPRSPSFRCSDHARATELALQQDQLRRLGQKSRLSHADKAAEEPRPSVRRHAAGELCTASQQRRAGASGHAVGRQLLFYMLALQWQSIALQKKQASPDGDTLPDDGDDWLPSGARQPAAEDAQPELVPQLLAMQGPAAVAWKLVADAACTEEQIDAVALFALSLRKRFDGRPDKTTHLRPMAPATGNRRVVCLGGGGVGKTRTLSKVVEPMAITYFGEQGYLGKGAVQPRGPQPWAARQDDALLQRIAHGGLPADRQAALDPADAEEAGPPDRHNRC